MFSIGKKPSGIGRSQFLISGGFALVWDFVLGLILTKPLAKLENTFCSLCTRLSICVPPSQRWWLRMDRGSCKWGHGPHRYSVVYVIASAHDPCGNVVAVGKSFVKTTSLGKLDHK